MILFFNFYRENEKGCLLFEIFCFCTKLIEIMSDFIPRFCSIHADNCRQITSSKTCKSPIYSSDFNPRFCSSQITAGK
jgi:hypothetical protein